MGKIKNFSEFINESKELIVNNTTLSPVNVGDIKILSSKEEIDRYSNFVWDMLEKSYEHILTLTPILRMRCYCSDCQGGRIF